MLQSRQAVSNMLLLGIDCYAIAPIYLDNHVLYIVLVVDNKCVYNRINNKNLDM